MTVLSPSAEEEGSVQLTASAVSQRMSRLLQEFSSSTVYSQWNMVADELAGVCACVCVRACVQGFRTYIHVHK